MRRWIRSRTERSNAVGLMASYLVILTGLCGVLVIGGFAAPKPDAAVLAAVALFAGIALIPAVVMRRGRGNPAFSRQPEPLWQRIRALFRKQEVRPLRPWKRKRPSPFNAPGGVFRTAAGVGSDLA